MEIFFEMEAIDVEDNPTAVALGTFDGLHIGHTEVLQTMKAASKKLGLKSFVYTFSNHPREILTPQNVPSKIMDIDEKVQIFTRIDVDFLALIKFDENQIRIEPEDFIKDILIGRLNMKHLTVGYDYRFGKKARGDVKMLLDFAPIYGYTYDIVEPVLKDGVRVSSTLIRELLAEGDIESANHYLGRHHFVKGTVVRGKGKGGSELGFPTANLRIRENVSTLKPGVYVTQTFLNGKFHQSVTNIGNNPTFNETGIHIETYIFDVDSTLYDETIEVHFLKRLRDEVKFDSFEALKEAMKQDVIQAKSYFSTLQE